MQTKLQYQIRRKTVTTPSQNRYKTVTKLEKNGHEPFIRAGDTPTTIRSSTSVNPFRTAVSFWGQLGANYLEFEWLVPKTGLEF